MKNYIDLGKEVRCKVSGFTGIVTSRTEYLNGCVQYGIRPKIDKEGKMVESSFIDSQQLEVIGDGVSVEAEPTGGESDDIAKISDSSDAPKSEY